MGSSGSKSTSAGRAGASSGVSVIDEKLSHLKHHAGDTMITHGLLQEITQIINRNSNGERERFCQLLLAASTGSSAELGDSVDQVPLGSTLSASSVANVGPTFQPFSELFSKVRLMTDAASKTSVVTWLRYVTEYNEAEWLPILSRNNIVTFITDFYLFQSNVHVPPETLTNMALLIARWSQSADLCFVNAMNEAEAFRGVLVRLRFAQTSSKERSGLVAAMRRCHRAGLSRSDAFDILMKIALERDESVDQTHIDVLEMISDALAQRPELMQTSVTPKQLASLQRFFGGSSGLVAAATRLFVVLYETETRLVGQPLPSSTISNPSPSSPLKSNSGVSLSMRPEILKTLCSAFDITLMDNPVIAPMALIASATLCLDAMGKSAVVSFVEQRGQLTLFVRKIYKSTIESNDLALRYSRLVHLMLEKAEEMAPHVALKLSAAQGLYLLLDAILSTTDETSMEAVVSAASAVCLAEPSIGGGLCADHKLHVLMQKASSPSSLITPAASPHRAAQQPSAPSPQRASIVTVGRSLSIATGSVAPDTTSPPRPPDAALMVVLGITRLLQRILTKEVLASADEMLIMVVFSLLCQILGSCQLPPRRYITSQKSVEPAPPSPPTITEKIVEACLQMLITRSQLGPSFAESILGQVPLGIVRAMLAAEHLPVLQNMARSLVTIMANSSMAAMAELSIMGCVVNRSDPISMRRSRSVVDTGGDGDGRSDQMVQKAVSRISKPRVTLRRFQRHWRKLLHVRRISENRVAMANHIKGTFMSRLDIVHHESTEFQQILDKWAGNLARIQHDYEERDHLVDQHERQTEVLRRAETNARVLILLQKCEDAEQRNRFRVRIEEQRDRVQFPPVRLLSGAEVSARCEIVAEFMEFARAQMVIHTTKMQAFHLLMVKRNAVVEAERHSRNSVMTQLENEVLRLFVVLSLMRLSDEERQARKSLSAVLLLEHKTFLREAFSILIQHAVEDETRVRESIEASRAREFYWLDDFYQQTSLLQDESYRRMEWILIEKRTYLTLLDRFVKLCTKQLCIDEGRQRALLQRDVVLQYRLLWLPFDRYNVIVAEDVRRRSQANDHRLGLLMLFEASRYVRPFVVQAEELRRRQEIDLEYLSIAQKWKWDLAYYRLVRDELAARNAISLQFFLIARNMLAPLMCLRLVDCQFRLLVADLDFRTNIWVLERDAFYVILLAEVRDMQRQFRAKIYEEQAEDHERLAQHFVTVTHVVRLQEQAQNSLCEYANQQRAMERNSGLKKPPESSASHSLHMSLVERVKRMAMSSAHSDYVRPASAAPM